MNRERHIGLHLLPVLTAGFTLLILLLVASACVGIQAMWSTESGAARLVESQRATLRLIEDIQRDEDSLSAVFFALAAGRGTRNNSALLDRLATLERTIRRTIDAG